MATSKDALETLARLEERLSKVEREATEGAGQGQAAVDGEGLLEYQKQVLGRLMTIRDALVADPAVDMAYVLKERHHLLALRITRPSLDQSGKVVLDWAA
jgi:hypothetical protein